VKLLRNALPVMMALGILAAPTAAVAQQTSGAQTFIGIQNGPDDPGRVIAVGTINATGSDEIVSDTEDVFHFPTGDLTVDHAVVSSQQSFDPATCLFQLTEIGTIDVVRGTGAYVGATGHGTSVVKIISRGCGETPSTFVFYLRTQGTLSLGR